MKRPEEVKRELVRQWLAKAEEDFGVAKHLLSEDAPFFGAIGFHAQQAGEKFLKAVLVRHQIEFHKTHDLGELLDLIERVDPSMGRPLRDATGLNPYGVDIRYPADFPDMTLDDATKAVALAAKVREAVNTMLRSYLSEPEE